MDASCQAPPASTFGCLPSRRQKRSTVQPGRKDDATMNGWQKLALAAFLSWPLAVSGAAFAAAQPKPEGEMRFAVYVTLAPAWLDPGEASPGFVTPFWLLVALHDALVKPMPGQ